MELSSDAELVSVCAADRGPKVWSRFIERFGMRLTMGVRRAFRRSGISPSPDEIEDLLQEVYCKLLDESGKAIGVLSIKSAAALGFAVPINDYKPLLEKNKPISIKRWLTIGAIDPGEWSPVMGGRWSQRAGRLNATHVRQRGVFSDDELGIFNASLRRDLLGTEAT